MFYGLRTDGAIVDDGAARDGILPLVNDDSRVHEIAVGVIVPGADFCHLTGSSSHRILVAIGARGGVVNRTEPSVVSFSCLKVLLIDGEGVRDEASERWFGDAVADALGAWVVRQ